MKTKVLLLFTACSLALLAHGRDFYQLKIYHLKTHQQSQQLEDFLQNAYLPALHRAGISKVGVFKPIAAPETESEQLVYVFIPYTSYDQFAALEDALQRDKMFKTDGEVYLNASYDRPPYDRIETILLNAFVDSPHVQLPDLTSPKSDRVYELRSYEGPTEAYYRNKVEMFNKGDEIGLFKRLGFNAVFYGEVVAGSRMPNLMYLTTFENKQSRDEHWEAFGKDAYWKELSARPEYQHNVSRNQQIFLYPAEYSDF
ncbi:NIPSNAP family protein [Parapedobacter indicus]|uniref:NIPSNAP protein n=1 Tax=Parapedobacter indicus TaxID=1477437 RepID=A0A1I3KLK8_9SPHI|nr:NIPSNAP family protein [Parapedobacter indicus]PPL01851.1 NIPSNAP protein [Parapedobacter indicus]SFI73055.1 NIPSNAP protein [Parapedobacter indicus]